MTKVMIFSVMLRVPDNTTPEDAFRDLRTSIGFGNPRIELQYVLPDAPEKIPEKRDLPSLEE